MTELECGCHTMSVAGRYHEAAIEWSMTELHPTVIRPSIWFWWCYRHNRWVPEKPSIGPATNKHLFPTTARDLQAATATGDPEKVAE